jgi:hypothetical protein
MIANSVFANVRIMNDLPNDRDFLNLLIKWSGKSASDLAKLAGLTPSTLTRPLNQNVPYKLSKATMDKLRAKFPGFPGFGIHDGDDRGVRSYVEIEILPSYAGMGGGGSGQGDRETGMISRNLVEDELRAKPEDLLLIDVRGDSMEPLFRQGDQLLVDRRDRNPIQPGPFAILEDDAYYVKLVERLPQRRGWYRIWSANERYGPYEVNEENLIIMGRPVWFARRL